MIEIVVSLAALPTQAIQRVRTSVRNLGICIDAHLVMRTHVQRTVSGCCVVATHGLRVCAVSSRSEWVGRTGTTVIDQTQFAQRHELIIM